MITNTKLGRPALLVFWVQLMVVLGLELYVERDSGLALKNYYTGHLSLPLIALALVMRLIMYAEMALILYVTYRSTYRNIFFRTNTVGRSVPTGLGYGLCAAMGIFIIVFRLFVRQ
jgi:hypothetical protein